LNWISNLNHVKNSITKKVNIIKIISWGGETSTLLKIYRALFRSSTDYGSIIFKTASPKHLKIIDMPLNTSIRLAIGSFKSSLIESLRNIANEPPPNIRKTLNSILYAARTIKNKNNPANKYIDTIIQEAENLQINIKEIVPREPQTIPPCLMQINTNTEVTENKKNNTNPNIYKNLFHDTI
jgi:hypothetical protein